MKASLRKSQSGFTLIELMVVVAIIGILASIGIPAMTKYIKTAETSEPTQRLADIAKNIQGHVDSHPNTTSWDGVFAGKLLNAACATTPAATCLNTIIPQLAISATSTWVYKVEVATVDATTKVASVCIGARKYASGASGTTVVGTVLYSSATSDSAQWQGNSNVTNYVVGADNAVVANGACAASAYNTGYDG